MNVSQEPQPKDPKQELWGLIYGAFGVMVFSLTLPATRIALTGFDPVFVGLGRAVVAACLSIVLLVATNNRSRLGDFFLTLLPWQVAALLVSPCYLA